MAQELNTLRRQYEDLVVRTNEVIRQRDEIAYAMVAIQLVLAHVSRLPSLEHSIGARVATMDARTPPRSHTTSPDSLDESEDEGSSGEEECFVTHEEDVRDYEEYRETLADLRSFRL